MSTIFDDEKDLLLDHDYDGIKELDNHMPKWWLYLFYFTIAFAVFYLVYFTFTGIGLNQHEEYEAELAEAVEKYGLTPEGEDEAGIPVAKEWVFETDAESIENGKAIYMSTNNLCFTCHGANGEGLVGPNLTDDMWIHGCAPADLAASITSGFPDKGMIAFGSGARLSDADLTDVISFIASLQGTEPANPKPVDEARAVNCSM